jgi:septum formation protein
VGERVSFVLASASPARLRTLRAGGIEPRVVVSGVDESLVEASDPRALCATLARLKAEAVADGMATDDPAAPRVVVLGCDSVLEFEGQALGKPADAVEANQRWQRMRGRRGILHTGHCLVDVPEGARAEAVASTTVHFADVTDEEIAAYVGTGEPLHVAGAFTIDGLGGWFVESIDGDPGTVIGVSLPLLRRLLAELGLGVHDLWAGPPVPVTGPTTGSSR